MAYIYRNESPGRNTSHSHPSNAQANSYNASASQTLQNYAQNASSSFSLPGLSFLDPSKGLQHGSAQTPVELDDDEDYYGESAQLEDVTPQVVRDAHKGSNGATPVDDAIPISAQEAEYSVDGTEKMKNSLHLPSNGNSFSLPGLGSYTSAAIAPMTSQPRSAPPIAQIATPLDTQSSVLIAPVAQAGMNTVVSRERVLAAFQEKFSFAIETLKQLHNCGISFDQLLALDLFSDRDKEELARLFGQAGLNTANPPSIRDVNEQLLRLATSQPAQSSRIRSDPRLGQVVTNGHHATERHVATGAFGSSQKSDVTHLPSSKVPILQNHTGAPRSVEESTVLVPTERAPSPHVGPTSLTPSQPPSSSAVAGDRSTYLARLQAARAKKSPLASQQASPAITAKPTPCPTAKVSTSTASDAHDEPPVTVTHAPNMATIPKPAAPSLLGETSCPKTSAKEKLRQKLEELRAQMAKSKASNSAVPSGSATPVVEPAITAPLTKETPLEPDATIWTEPAPGLTESDTEMDEEDDEDNEDDYEPEIPAQSGFATPSNPSTSVPIADVNAVPFALSSQSNTPTPAATYQPNPYEQQLKAKEAEIVAMRERIAARARERLALAKVASAQAIANGTPQDINPRPSSQGISHAVPLDLMGNIAPSAPEASDAAPSLQATISGTLTGPGDTPSQPVQDARAMESTSQLSNQATEPSIIANSGLSEVSERGRQTIKDVPKRPAFSPLRNGVDEKRLRIGDPSSISMPAPMSAKARRLMEIQEEMRRAQEALEKEEIERERLAAQLGVLGYDTEGKSLEELEEMNKTVQDVRLFGERGEHLSEPSLSNGLPDSLQTSESDRLVSQGSIAPTASPQALQSETTRDNRGTKPAEPQTNDEVPMELVEPEEFTNLESSSSSDVMVIDDEDVQTPGESIDKLIAPTEVGEESENTRIHVKNLPYSTTEQDLRAFFKDYSVEAIEICMHPQTGRSKGFGFVTVPSDTQAQAAIKQLDGQRIGSEGAGRQIKLRIATSVRGVPPATANIQPSQIEEIEEPAPVGDASEIVILDDDEEEYEPSIGLDSRADEIHKLPEKTIDQPTIQESEDLTDESMSVSSDEGEISESEQEVVEAPTPRAPPTGPRNPQSDGLRASNEQTMSPRGPMASAQQNGYQQQNNPYSHYQQHHGRQDQQRSYHQQDPTHRNHMSHINRAAPRSGPYSGPRDYPILGLKYPENAAKPAESTGNNSTAEANPVADPDNHLYDSPLRLFKSYRYHPDYTKTHKYQSLTYSHKLDPDLPLCPNELDQGECHGKNCIFQHLNQAKLDGSSLLAELGAQNPEPTLDNAVYAGGLRELIQDIKARNLESTEEICGEIVGYANKSKKDPTRVLTI